MVMASHQRDGNGRVSDGDVSDGRDGDADGSISSEHSHQHDGRKDAHDGDELNAAVSEQ